MNQRADWISWIMQFLVGMIVGAGLGLVICMAMMGARRRRHSVPEYFTPEDALIFIGATSLAAAGLAAYKGDRLWFKKPSIFIPLGHKHSPFSKALALFITSIGFAAMGFVVIRIIWRPFESAF